MKNSTKNVLLTLLKTFAALVAGYYIVLFLYIAISRLAFPIAIDWVEGAVLIQVDHLLAGGAMYAQPTAAYTALIYPPFYFYVAAAFARLLGVGFLPLRLTSLLSTCGCLIVIFYMVYRNTRSKLYAFIAAGFFAATYASVWSWFDFARVDMLFVFFCLLGLYFLSSAQTNPRAAVAALFFALAFFTKQSALFIVAPLAVLYFFYRRKQALAFVVIFAVLASLGLLLFNLSSAGWYNYYVFTLPANHKLATSFPSVISLIQVMLGPILVALVVSLLPLLFQRQEPPPDTLYHFFLFAVAAVMLGTMVGALSPGSTHNAYIPAYATLAILLGISLQQLQQMLAGLEHPPEWGKALLIALLPALCLVQFWLLQYQPRDYVPTGQDWKRAAVLIKSLKGTPADFIAPMHAYLALYVDKPVLYDEAPLWELNGQVGKRPLPEWSSIADETRHIVQSQQAAFVYMTVPSHTWQKMTCEKADVLNSNSKFVPTLYQMVCK